MEPERKGLVAAGLAALFAALMGGALAATGAWRNALFLGAADAATAAAGPGFYELLFNAVIPDKLAEAGTPAPIPPPGASMGEPAAMPPDVAAALAAAKEAMAAADRLANCTGSDCAAAAAAAAEAAARQAAGASEASGPAGSGSEEPASADADEERLRLIKMRERAAGETKLYGGGTAAPRPAKMSAADVEASFGGMIQRLKQRAGKEGGAAPTVGGSESAGRAAASGGGDDSPIMTQENQSDKLNSPTLRALQKLNKDSRHSVGMSRDEGTTDGSRDKAGKSFDGNRATFGAIPIAETTGAMGRKQIKAADEPIPSDIQGQPVR